MSGTADVVGCLNGIEVTNQEIRKEAVISDLHSSEGIHLR